MRNIGKQLHSTCVGCILWGGQAWSEYELIEPILFADDTSVIISYANFIDFTTSTNQVFARMIECFSANKLVLNLEKTNIMKSVTINKPYCALTLSHKDKCIEQAVNLKFLVIQIENPVFKLSPCSNFNVFLFG